VPLPKPASTDFVSFYAAGALADAGTPQLAYNEAQHHAAEERATEPGIDYNFFYYPPIFILICAALARLPYLAAFLFFQITTLAAYLLVARAILNERDWAMLLPVVAFPPILWNFGFGQNAFLTAALFGAATLYIDRRPVVAGLLFGALCYKPQFGLLIPVALAAGGHWRAVRRHLRRLQCSRFYRLPPSAGRPGTASLPPCQHRLRFMNPGVSGSAAI